MANEAAAKAQSIKDECENELTEALPALKEAEEALSKFASLDDEFVYPMFLKIRSNPVNWLLSKR